MKTEPLLINVPPKIPERIRTGPEAIDLWVVFTWYDPNSRWKLWRKEFTTEAAAYRYINMDIPRGHTHAVVFHLTTK